MYNLLIPDDFFLYLEANGFHLYVSDDKRTVSAIDRERGVQIRNDTASFLKYYHGSDDETADFSIYASVSGVSQMDIFKWQLVLHAFDVVPLQQFMKRAKVQGHDLFHDMVKIIAPEHLPECY